MLTFVFVFFIALLTSFILTPLIRNRAASLGLIDQPSEARQIHTLPTPRAGGIAIFGAFIIALVFVSFLSNQPGRGFRQELPTLLRILVPCLIMFLLGLVDDLHRLSARVKFLVQIATAIGFYFFTARISTIGNPLSGSVIELGWLALPITVLWLVGITNAFNLIDGIDGLSAGSALFATLAMMCVAVINGNLLVVILTCAMAGAILGFLKYNFNPATIFMGDSGSLFIGFTLAALGVHGAQKNTTVIAIAIPLVSFGLPVMETTLSIARRWLSGQPLFAADQRHIHHQLLAKGLSHRQVVILLYGVSAVYAILSLLLIDSPVRLVGLTLLTFGISAWIGIQHLGYHEFGELGRLFQRSLRQRAVIMNNIRLHNAINGFSSARDFHQLLDRLEESLQVLNFSRVEMRLPRHYFPDFTEHRHFIVCQHETELVVVWLNSISELASLADHDMIEMRVPLRSEEGVGTINFSHNFQSKSVLLDINMLFNSFRLKLEQSVDRLRTRSQASQSDQIIPAEIAARK